MKKFHIITIFPDIFESYFSESIIKRALKKELIAIDVANLRDYSPDKHRTVDDAPFGGGAGMILKVQPIFDCIKSLKSNIKKKKRKTRVVLFSAKGKRYTQRDAVRLSGYDNLILICGRYEGVDERVAKHIADEEISIGDYILTGGEIPAMILVDSITRLIPGVLGNPESLNEESHNTTIQNSALPAGSQESKIKNSVLEYPQYTRPEIFNGWKVPKILLSGNHKEIEEWREEKSIIKKNKK